MRPKPETEVNQQMGKTASSLDSDRKTAEVKSASDRDERGAPDRKRDSLFAAEGMEIARGGAPDVAAREVF